MSESANLHRTIKLPAAIALVVGAVVGAGIYALVGEIGQNAGSTMWLAFIIAIVISVLGVIPLIQIAGAIPRAGAGYTFGSRLLSPYIGVMTSSIVLLAGAASTCIVAYGLARYLRGVYGVTILGGYFEGPFGEQLDAKLVGLICMAGFYVVYVVGIRLALTLQMLMAVQFMIALAIYVAAGLLHSGADFSLVPEPEAQSFLIAVLLCYSTCMGFQVVAELGEEIDNPRRNIPLALIIGGGIVAVIYVLVSAVFTASIPFDPALYKAMDAPLIDSAKLFLPDWSLHFMTFGAVTAALTSFNAAAVALPRELFAMGREEVLPKWLGVVNPRNHTPMRAVSVYFVFSALMLLLPIGYDFYGVMTAVGIQVMSGVLAVGAIRLPYHFPKHYASAYLRFPVWLLWFCGIATVLLSIAFVGVMALEQPLVLVSYGVWIVVISGYYLFRVGQMEKDGRPWRKEISALHEAGE